MRLLFVPLLALAALSSPQARIEFHPQEGSELAKKFETSVSLALDDLRFDMNGQTVDPAAFVQGLDLDALNLEFAVAQSVRDTYVALGEGRPRELLREFSSFHATYEDGLGNTDTDDGGEGKLIGRTVRFEWKPDEGIYARSFEGEGGDEKDLLPLNEDMDLRDLIPAADVEEGGEWSITWSEHLGLIMPGVDLTAARAKLYEEIDADTSEGAEIGRPMVDAILNGLSGAFSDATATCKLDGTREVDGRQMQVVSIQSTIEGTLDLSSFADAVQAQIPEEVTLDHIDLDLDLSLDLTGELLWDLAGGHYHSLEISGELSGEVALDVAVDSQGTPFKVAAWAEFSGELTRTASIE